MEQWEVGQKLGQSVCLRLAMQGTQERCRWEDKHSPDKDHSSFEVTDTKGVNTQDEHTSIVGLLFQLLEFL